MRAWKIIFVAGVVGVALGYWLGCSRTPHPKNITEVVRDTIVMREVVADTVTLSRIVYRDLPTIERDTTYLRDTTYVRDTVRVAVPLSLYTFEEEDWRAEVEGYAVTLREVEVFPQTVYQTKIVEQEQRWGVGIQAGMTISQSGVAPYLGVGIQYTLFGW